MNPGRRVIRLASPVLVVAVLGAPAGAQDTTVVQPDTLPPADSIVVPPVGVVPVPEPALPPGPLPPGTRFTFTRDSIVWSSAVTLAELLAAVPGVFIARAGFLGQPEYVQYGGRAGSSVEIYWDGLRMEPVGPDSLFHDLARINLTNLDRVDVIVYPSVLRVYIVSTRLTSLTPRTELRVMTGDFDIGTYAGVFQKRWPSGAGVNVGGDFVGTDGASGPSRSDQTFDLWARVDWLPSDRFGSTYQVRRQRHDRDPVGSVPDVEGRLGTRTDFLFALFAGTRDDGLGLRAEATLASTAWSSDSLTPEVPDQVIRQAGLSVRYRRPTWTLQVAGRVGDARFTSSVEGRLAWTPLPGVVVAGDAEWTHLTNDRTSLSAAGTAGLYAGPFSVVGTIHHQDVVPTPALLSDSAQVTLGRSVRAGIATPFLTGHVALVRREAFLPRPYPDLGVIAQFDTSRARTMVVADVRLQSSRALALHAWYATPVRGEAPSLQPPKHGRVQIVFRSKFWRTFRSGAFDFKLQLGMEFWSTGTAGLDASGAPIPMPGLTFYDGLIQFQIAQFAGFYNLRNAYNSPDPYIPGLVYPRTAQMFGVKWEFAN